MATIVNEKTKSIFIHIPKCAGTTISSALIESAPDDWVPGSRLPGIAEAVKHRFGENRDRVWEDHCRYRDLVQLMGQEALEGYTIFTATRMPFDRAESTYYYIRRLYGTPLSDLIRGMTFSDFLYYYSNIAAALQVDWLNDDTGSVSGNIKIYDSNEIDGRLGDFVQERFGVNIKGQRKNISRPVSDETSSEFEFANAPAVRTFKRAYERDFLALGYDQARYFPDLELTGHEAIPQLSEKDLWLSAQVEDTGLAKRHKEMTGLSAACLARLYAMKLQNEL